MISDMTTRTTVNKLLRMFNHAGYEAYIVGGAVRDGIMERPIHDYDITTSATPEQIIEFADKNNIHSIPTGIDFGTITLLFNKEAFQVTTFRIDADEYDGRHTRVFWATNLNLDLSRRDFTINAMAMNYYGHIFDPFCGQHDIQKKIIRAVGNPIHRFMGAGKTQKGDRLRSVRAARFATTLDFRIDPPTYDAMTQTDITGVAKERIRDEFIKIIMSPNRVNGFKLLDKSGLLKQFIPEFEALKGLPVGGIEHHPEKDTFIHTIAALASLKKNASLDLILATLLHDIGKPATQNELHFYNHEVVGAEMTDNILKRLEFTKVVRSRVKFLVANHMRMHLFNDMRESKKIRLIQHEQFPDLWDLLRADIMVAEDMYKVDIIQQFKSEFYHHPAPPVRLITGHDVLKSGIKPGPEVAIILTEIEDQILEGRIIDRVGALRMLYRMQINKILDRRKDVSIILS